LSLEWFVGFALAVHAVHGSNGLIVGALALVAFIGTVRSNGRSNHDAATSPREMTALPFTRPSSAPTDDAQSGSARLSHTAREAKTATASMVMTVGADADAATIVRTVLRANGGGKWPSRRDGPSLDASPGLRTALINSALGKWRSRCDEPLPDAQRGGPHRKLSF
jgi:hypothetical protein